ncbi:VUT family protein [Mycobacterium kyogaense]|uniref:VUT family protein n=1 Tax=Mycobacterium kyogaense TaxID=2212479 RepID=UPI001F09538A|nr:VUT family protein [Mycobacterium kyogaense]
MSSSSYTASLTWRLHIVSAAWVFAFIGCIVGANWAILHLGANHGPGVPRTIPIGFGLAAPSGVLFAGAQLTLRDLIHERLGTSRTLGVIGLSAPLTVLVASPALAVAPITTFLAAETADLAVYSRLRSRGYTSAVVGSNLISAVVDSILFLAIAFGLAQVATGTVEMTVGKLEASVITLVAVGAAGALGRRWVHRHLGAKGSNCAADRHDMDGDSPGFQI